MTDIEKEKAQNLAEIYAVENAENHGGEASVDAVMGKLMNEKPELRDNISEVTDIVKEAVKKVNSFSKEKRKKKKEDSDIITQKESEEEEKLPDLPNTKNVDEIVTRFAPNPNGAPTIGSVRGLILNDYYAKRYDGKLILRFDDTDPVNKPPLKEAYEWWKEDSEWLGIKIDEVVRASKRLRKYYDYAFKLIEKGAAYACNCTQDEFSNLREKGESCPHRNRSIEKSKKELDEMIEGNRQKGEVVIRIKTDMSHSNPAVRDWVALRIAEKPHPLEGKKWVWPTLDFQSGIDDHLLGVTHILRGKDLRDSEDRQRYLYEYLGWKYPETLHWGRLSIEEYGTLSTSSIASSIKNGEYEGWEDPRLPTVRALKRRGIDPKALKNSILELGISEVDAEFSMEHVYAENRKIVDEKSNRYFLVRNPKEIKIEGAESTISTPPLHPDQERGKREINVDNKVLVESEDISVGEKTRLKNLYNIQFISKDRAKYIGNDISLVRDENIDVIHWLPDDSLNAILKTPQEDIKSKVEKGIKNEIGNTVQFERVGFSRVEEIDKDNSKEVVIAIFGHR